MSQEETSQEETVQHDKIYILKDKKSALDQRVLITAKYAGVHLEEVELESGKGTKTEEFKKLNPRQTCPTLETSKGAIWSSLAIQRYFSSFRPSLHGSNSFEQAHMDCLLEWADEVIGHAVGPFFRHHVGLSSTKPTKPELKALQEGIDSFMPYLDELLEEETYLQGNHVTLFDINVAVWLKCLFEAYIEDRKKYRNVTRWFQSMINQKEFKSVVGPVKLKEAKKEIVSTLDMESWKRFYMNNPHKDAVEYLWKNVDIKVNSFWVADYKDFAELTGKKLYLTRNLTSGIAQRAQEYSKSTFGIIYIVGKEEAEHTIKILWLFESKSVPKEFQELSDYDSFNWKNVNWKKESDKKEIESYLLQEGPIGDLPILDTKVFR
jgi:elongation factor 1-gamma